MPVVAVARVGIHTSERMPIVSLAGDQDPLRWVTGFGVHRPGVWRRGIMDEMQKVLDFWFAQDTKPSWFAPKPDFDQAIRARFGQTFARAAAGELNGWEASPEGCVALCLLLDQMPRHMFRGTPRAFATDDAALAVAKRAVYRGFDRRLSPDYKNFLYMPFMHSERLVDQLRAPALFEAAGLSEALGYAKDHLSIIRRFGRFPHRNAILGRTSTPEELEFLAQQDHYGQRAEEAPDRGLQAVSGNR
jgi:uncharacterized protein (DUF924 family)